MPESLDQPMACGSSGLPVTMSASITNWALPACDDRRLVRLCVTWGYLRVGQASKSRMPPGQDSSAGCPWRTGGTGRRTASCSVTPDS
jgi:hypothetical protein